jgi:carboxypeptidase C (cathepsin A)
LQADLPKALAEAREFAKGEYASALQQGAALPADEREKIVAELARLTGLKPQVIEDNHLRIDEGVFRKQLLHDEGLILGAYDARITGRDDDPASPYPDFDPSDAAVLGAVFRRDEFLCARRIEIRGRSALRNPRRRAAVELRRANTTPARATGWPVMNQNPYMKILVLGGRCDLVCPIDTVHYALDHMPLDAAYRTNITYAEFDAGHMMYINLPDLKKCRRFWKIF